MIDLSSLKITEQEKKALNEWVGFFSYKPTWQFNQLINCEEKFICLFTGNQSFKTSGVAMYNVMSILGILPVEKKNIRPTDPVRILRFASERLPGEGGDNNREIKNTQYPEFKKWLPPSLIKKDITSKVPVMSIRDPQGGSDIIVEFVSFTQSVQAQAGVQRRRIWIDEHCLAKGQRVLMSNGIWRPIEDIKINDELICETIGGFGSRQRTNIVSNVWSNGLKDVYKVKCQKGIEFECTDNHRIMVPSIGKSEYKMLKDLSKGDYIKCNLSDIEGEKTLENWQLVLTAIMLGDGNSTQDIAMFSCANPDLVEDVKKYLPEDLEIKKRKQETRCSTYTIIRKKRTGHYNKFISFLKEQNLWGKKADTKFVPDIFFTQTKEDISLFLKYLYATDGWASGHMIGYCSTSKKLSEDVHFLLRRLGIRSTIQIKKQNGNWKKQYWVAITQSKDVIQFINKVSIACKEKYINKVKVEAERRLNVRTIHKDKKPKNKVKIISIERIGKKEVFDIEMQENKRSPRNNFLIQGGVVVHNCSRSFYEEQLPRLLAADGDMMFTLTPAQDYLDWEYDEFYERARRIIRTPSIVKYEWEHNKEKHDPVELTGHQSNIVIIMAATDDNPVLDKQTVENMYAMFSDPEVVAVRRYGQFKQISGKVFKAMDKRIHVISKDKYFPNGMPYDWIHARGIDYHENNPWAVGWIALSPTNEVFIYNELLPSSEMVSLDIATAIASKSGDYKYSLNLIDPLAAKKQANTGMSVVDDLNRYFYEFQKDGFGTGGYWRTWDTKSTRGRDEIRSRLNNSKLVGVPFNNKITRDGRSIHLPTIWILDNCRLAAEYMYQWRREEWASRDATLIKDNKDEVQQKWSHFNMIWEAMFKTPTFSINRYVGSAVNSRPQPYQNYMRR